MMPQCLFSSGPILWIRFQHPHHQVPALSRDVLCLLKCVGEVTLNVLLYNLLGGLTIKQILSS